MDTTSPNQPRSDETGLDAEEPSPATGSPAEVLLTHGVAIEPEGDRVRYIVPPEDSRRGRALLQLVLGVVATVAIVVAIYLMYTRGEDEWVPLESLLSPYLEMSVFFALAVVADAGRRLLAAERVIDVSPHAVSVLMRVPLLRLRFTRRAEKLQALLVTDPPTRPHMLGGAEPVPSTLRLRAAPRRGRSLTLAIADADIAVALADDLAEQLAAFGYDVPVERMDAIAQLDRETEAIAADPPREKAVVMRSGDRLEIIAGPTGFFRRLSAYGGHIALALVLLASTVWLTVLAVFWLTEWRSFLLVAATVIFALAAYTATVAYRRMGRHEDVIVVEPDAVLINSQLGRQVQAHAFSRHDLQTVLANEGQLTFVEHTGETTNVSLLRHKDFVAWLAATLRRECGLVGGKAVVDDEAGETQAEA